MDRKNCDNLFNNSIADLNSSKSDVDKLGIDKLEIAPVDLSKLCDVVKLKLLRRMCVMNKLKNLMLFRLLILVT